MAEYAAGGHTNMQSQNMGGAQLFDTEFESKVLQEL